MLELVKLVEPVDRAEAFGRIAFSCPRAEVGIIYQTPYQWIYLRPASYSSNSLSKLHI